MTGMLKGYQGNMFKDQKINNVTGMEDINIFRSLGHKEEQGICGEHVVVEQGEANIGRGRCQTNKRKRQLKGEPPDRT